MGKGGRETGIGAKPGNHLVHTIGETEASPPTGHVCHLALYNYFLVIPEI